MLSGVSEKLSCEGDELIEKILCLIELEETLDRRELSYKEAAEILRTSRKIGALKKREFKLEGGIEEMKSRRAEVEEQIEQKEKALEGLKTEMGERLSSLGFEDYVEGTLLVILTDRGIKKQFNQMFWRGYRPDDFLALCEKIIEKIKRSQEFLLKQAAEMEEVSAQCKALRK